MKECPSCKAKNRNDAAFCAECGADLKNVAPAADEWAAAAGDLLNKAKEAAATGAKKAKEAAATGAEKVQKAVEDADKKAQAAKAAGVSAGGWDDAIETQGHGPSGGSASYGGGAAPRKDASIFVDQSESIVATIGSNYLQSFLIGGAVKKGVGVLTQKRFYYKGKNFFGTGKDIKSATEEGVVSIEGITFTKFTHVRHTGFLLFAILLTVAALILAVSIPHNKTFFMACLLAALPFYILYFVKRSSLFLVAFPGGGFAFDIHWYPIADIRDFQRQLHLLKDHRKEGGDA